MARNERSVGMTMLGSSKRKEQRTPPRYADDGPLHYKLQGEAFDESSPEFKLTATVQLREETNEYIRYLCYKHGRGISYVMDRVILAAKYGVPVQMDTRIPVMARKGLEYLEKRRQLEKMARDAAKARERAAKFKGL